jgi:RNA polymerase sigma-70 factor (ECF subfamily)
MPDPTSDLDLDSLIERSGRGDRDAFRQLYDRVSPKIMAISLRMLGDHHQAEDVLQQTMLAAWNAAADFDRRKSGASTWLVSIARYRALDLLRKSQRQRSTLEAQGQDVIQVLGHDQPLSRSSDLPARTQSRLEECLREIRRDEAGCIELAYIDGLTFAEIAARLDRSLGTVKSWIRRGVQKLRVCIER